MAPCLYPNLAGINLNCTYFGQQVQNTLYAVGVNEWTDEELQELVETVADWWTAELQALVSDSLTLVTVEGRDLGNLDSYVVEFNPSSGNVGTVSSPGLPGNVTMTVKFLSGKAGRSKRGRNYVLGLAENRVTGNEVISPYPADFVAAYEALNGFLGLVNSSFHVIFSRKACGPGEFEGNVERVTSYATDGVLDSQRRRLPGRGS